MLPRAQGRFPYSWALVQPALAASDSHHTPTLLCTTILPSDLRQGTLAFLFVPSVGHVLPLRFLQQSSNEVKAFLNM